MPVGTIGRFSSEEMELLNSLGDVYTPKQRKQIEEFGKRNPKFRGAVAVLESARKNPHGHHVGLALLGGRMLAFTVGNGQPLNVAAASYHFERLVQGRPKLAVITRSVPVSGIQAVISLVTTPITDAAEFVATEINPFLVAHQVSPHSTNVRPNILGTAIETLYVDYGVKGIYIAN